MPLVESIGHQLPFLLKCLSIRDALSIQAHPDEALAKQLHDRSPDNYPDDQPKPEMAVAINSRFEALVGFVDISEQSSMSAGAETPLPLPRSFLLSSCRDQDRLHSLGLHGIRHVK